MTIIACPNCRQSLEIRSVDAGEGSDQPLGTTELKAVQSFIRVSGPGRKYASELHAAYTLWSEGQGWPPLTKNGLARALRMCGATPWRSAIGRGWQLPRLEADTKPPKPKPSVLQDEIDQEYREFVSLARPAAPPQPQEKTLEERLAELPPRTTPPKLTQQDLDELPFAIDYTPES